MNKLLTIFGATTLAFGALWSYADSQPQTIQGVPLKANQKSVRPQATIRAEKSTFSFEEITNWSGEGENQAALVLQWSDERENNAIVYGYRWDGEVSSADMLQAIVENNPQLYVLYNTTSYGCTLAGIGFDRYNDGNISVSNDATTYDNATGWLDIAADGEYSYTDFAKFNADDDTDLWNSGFAYDGEGYWSYYIGTSFANDFGYSNYGLSGNMLTDGDINILSFTFDFSFNLGTLVAAPSVIPTGVEKQFTVDGINYAVLNYDTKTVAVVASEEFSYADDIIIPATVVNGDNSYTVTEIGSNAFMGCAVSSVTIPATVTLISPMAFYGTAIDDIIVLGKTPAKLCTDAFYEEMPPSNAVTVPAGCGDAYKAAWTAVANQIVESDKGASEYLDFSKINVWVGEGDSQAALMLTFGDDKGMDNLVLGVRFDGTATAADILKAASDFKRITLTDDALTYDLNGDGSVNATYDHSTSAYNYFIDHTGAMATATADAKVADKDIVYVSAANEAAYPEYKFYVPTDDKTGVWVLDEYTVHLSTSKQSFPFYINVDEYSATSVTASFVDDNGKTDSTKATMSFTNATKGNCCATVTTKAMGTVNVKVRAKINNAFTDYSVCKLTIDESVNQYESLTYAGNTTIDQYGVLQITPANFTTTSATVDYPTLTFSVSDSEVIYAYSNQYFIGVKPGECDITATTNDGSNISTTFHVTVEERERAVPEDNYQDGVFMLNEDWYGHAPGSINYFDADGKLYANAYETNNPGFGFGNSSQFGTIFADRLFVSSKKSLVGSTVQNGKTGGGRLVIADANTLKFITEFDEIGNDGRAIVGVNENKVYVGMSQNIRVLNIDTKNDEYSLGGTIASSGEILAMEAVANRVFAFDKKTNNVIVINAETDEVITNIGESVVGLAQSADGNIWIAQEKKLFCYNPTTLELIKEQDIASTTVFSKGAGYPDNFCASPKENVLFWRDKSGNIYRWDLDQEAPVLLTKITGTFYSAINYDYKSNQLIVGMAPYTMDSNSVNFINATTGEVKNVVLPDYFWFPSIAISTDKYAAEFATDNFNFSKNSIGTNTKFDLRDFINDKDNNNDKIVISLNGENAISNNGAANITFADEVIHISIVAPGTETVALKAVSNGRVTETTLKFIIPSEESGVDDIDASSFGISVNGSTFTFTGCADTVAFVYSANGKLLKSAPIASNDYSVDFGLSAGVYFVKLSNGVVKKAVIK